MVSVGSGQWELPLYSGYLWNTCCQLGSHTCRPITGQDGTCDPVAQIGNLRLRKLE
jgi:hypothetical protein